MFNEQSIANCILPLAQFAQASDPNYPAIDPRLTTSITGRTIQGTYSLCSIENLVAAAPNFDNYVYPAWANGVAIGANVMVAYNGTQYYSTQPLTALQNVVTPDISPNYIATNPFNQWLYELKYQAAIELASILFRNRKIVQTSKTLLESTRLYEGGGLLNTRIVNTGAFVGFALELKPNENIINYITQIGIQLDGAVEGLNIYLFHSSVSSPLATAQVNATGGLTFNWTQLAGNGIGFKSHDYDPALGHDTGGVFFLGYYQNDLGAVQAIQKQFNISVTPCIACSPYNILAYRKWNKFIKATAISVPAEELATVNGPQMWDVSMTQFAYNTNWGLNFAFMVKCDVTQFLCNNAIVFADAYAKMVALKCAEVMSNSTNINGVAANVKVLSASELDPKAGSGSIRDQFNDTIKALDFDVSGFEENCLACDKKGKIYWGDSI